MSGVTMRKRQKLVLVTVLLTAGLAVTDWINFEFRYIWVGVFTVVTWLMSAWSLKEGMNGIEWLTILIPGTLFFAGSGLFLMLLPDKWVVKSIFVLLCGIAEYFLLLTANIFSVAKIRTIALFRAALAVSFVMTVVTAFFIFNTILSFRQPFWAIGLFVVLGSALLLLPALWAVELKPVLDQRVIRYTWFLALYIGFFGVAISFWPISTAVASIFMATVMYVFLGLSQHHFSGRLFPKTVWEYVPFGLVVLITMLLTAGRGV